MKTNQKGFSAVEAIVIIIVVGLLALAGWYVWKKNQDKDAKDKNPVSSQTQNKAPVKTDDVQTPDPYAGWENGELAYEKITYKYPADWKHDAKSTPGGGAGTVKPGSEDLILTGPKSSLVLEVRAGLDGVGSAVGQKVVDSEPVTLLGGQYYLNFYNFGEGDKVYGACVDASKTSADKLAGKNIITSSGVKAPMAICIRYPLVQGDYTQETVDKFKNDPSFADVKRILESFKY